MALRKPASVRLAVFRGRGPRDGLQGVEVPAAPAPTTPPPRPRGLPPDPHTLALGLGLHVAVAVFRPGPGVQLGRGLIYSYDLRLTPDDGGPEVGLAELDLLTDRDDADPRRRQRALGFDPGYMPSFIVPPGAATDLRLAHGSCRWTAGPGRDALPILDELLAGARDDAEGRVHQLWLTGDQIYGNSEAPELLHALTEATKVLFGGDRTVERLTVTDRHNRNPIAYPIDAEHFPAGRRLMLANLIGGLTAMGNHSSAFGFGEYAAIYLAYWHPSLWPDLRELLAARWTQVEAYRDRRRELRRRSTAATTVRRPDNYLTLEARWTAARLVPLAARQIDRYLTTEDRFAAWDEPPTTEDPQHWRGYWKKLGALEELGGPPEDPDVPPMAPDDQTHEADRRLARQLTPSWWAGDSPFGCSVDVKAEDPSQAVTSDKVRDRLHLLHYFLEDLPAVRRVLANVATYMVFDDHEVTEDWNVTAGWITRVRANPLGRAVIRNGLAAFLVFQYWGNNPDAFLAADAPPAQTLRAVASMFLDEQGQRREAGPPEEVAAALDERFNNRPIPAPPVDETRRMRWNFRVDGPTYEIIALDTRTERSYEPEADPMLGEPFTNHANAPLMSSEAIARQIPVSPAAGVAADGVCIVVSAAPVFGPASEESFALTIQHVLEAASPPPRGRWAQWRRGEHFGRVTTEAEQWSVVPRAIVALLARLSTRSSVVFLSGDVHYGTSMAQSHWTQEPDGRWRTTRFVQCTSSGLRNMVDARMWLSMDLAQLVMRSVSTPIERLIWYKRPPIDGDPIAPPHGPADYNVRLRYLLQCDPIILAPSALPAGTIQVRRPDHAFRREWLEDRRPDAERFVGLIPPAFVADEGRLDRVAAMAQSVAERVHWQATRIPSRRLMLWNNLGLVDFARPTDGPPTVRHRLFTYDLDNPHAPGRAFLEVVTPRVVTPDETPPEVYSPVTPPPIGAGDS